MHLARQRIERDGKLRRREAEQGRNRRQRVVEREILRRRNRLLVRRGAGDRAMFDVIVTSSTSVGV
jgi:hypothetical protein